MTGREVINSKLIQTRKVLLLVLFIIPIMFCFGIFFSKHSVSDLLSVIFPILTGSSYVIWLYYQAIAIPCPFCDKKIPWEYSGNFRLLSNDYKYCPYCRAMFDGDVNDGSKKTISDMLQKHKLDNKDVSNKTTGRNAINAIISRNRFKGLIVSLAILTPMIVVGYHWPDSISKTFLVWVVSLGVCLNVRVLVNASSRATCPFCGKRIHLLMKGGDKWKLGNDFLFCQKCGVPVDEQL